MQLPTLPINEILPDVVTSATTKGVVVVQAPPGAGKTTLVPLALLRANASKGCIIMLEPRRIAARAAATRMADMLGEKVGQTIGYRIKGETKVSPQTRIEVVTEGILTRMVQSDPELPGIGTIIFDEFHERSLNADLGLALVWQAREVLRPDLAVIVMSATLDAEPIAQLLGADILTSKGRAFPVETIWMDKPVGPNNRLETSIATLIERALDEEPAGGVLVFLPGAPEINRVARVLEGRLPQNVSVLPLYSALPFAKQQRAIEPPEHGRKVVLATSIAETSLTIQDVRCVVDSGLSRRVRFSPATGMSALITEKVTHAEADQRRGRAGRVGPGRCYRHWTKASEGALAAFPQPEIEAGDLAGLALELAVAGSDANDLAFVTLPSAAGLSAAQSLLTSLGVLDGDGRITQHGQRVAQYPLHPRLAHMVEKGGRAAAGLAALLSNPDPMRSLGADLEKRRNLAQSPATSAIQRDTNRIEKLAPSRVSLDWPQAAALAYPDRIAKRRPGDEARYVLSGGRGATLSNSEEIANAQYLVITDLDGAGRDAKVRRAIVITEQQLRDVFDTEIQTLRTCNWSKKDGKIIASMRQMLGAISLKDQVWADPSRAELEAALVDAIADQGLNFDGAAKRLQARVAIVRTEMPDLPDLSSDHLIKSAREWLLPHLTKLPRASADLQNLDLYPAMRHLLDWQQTRHIDAVAPEKFQAPTGRDVQIIYEDDAPEVSIKLQELFGLMVHPKVGQRPIRFNLLSPAGRTIQTTADIPGFWENSYEDVRKDMRGRYPKHPWPDDPANAIPTARAKPRKH